MPRRCRVALPGTIHHIVNRGNRRQAIFRDSHDYREFLGLLSDAGRRFAISLLAYALMPNHWHLVLRVNEAGALSAYVHWLGTVHARRHHTRYGSVGTGHLYQGRFKSFLIQQDAHLLAVLRYVEANALRAGLVPSAEDWPWTSLRVRLDADPESLLREWPITRPSEWLAYVNTHSPQSELDRIRNAAQRGCPFGQQGWMKAVVSEHQLENTVRLRGRPPNQPRPRA